MREYNAPVAVALLRGWFCLSRDAWQRPETFWPSHLGVGDATGPGCH